ncbi:hypothetical protein [Pseudanabaena sp. FACHB-2040]|uniref:hypothetical protein n=1 Tax=Pseudanabaena sp. FACHB-2040 TaxID=2692859 RepID=UPI00168940CF|nr:hypothetical protein [Pseudanabaena sp. FACHB-2040]MBD2260558.1 hypothetical protein [Pseudanabaena sp. FACHB-2040]
MGLRKVMCQVLTLDPDYAETTTGVERARHLAQRVVILAAISHALGSIVILLIYQISWPLLLLGFAVNGAALWAGYPVWTFTVMKLGQLLRLRSPAYRQILPPIGLAHVPQMLNFLTVVPLLGRPIEIGLAAWSLLAAIVTIQRQFDVRYRTAIALCSPGWLLVQVAIGTVQVLVQRAAEP